MAEAAVEYQRDNLCTVVSDYIKEQILIGKYKAGDHVLEATIAKNLGISRSPVREGIKDLEKEGIVEIVPRKGTYVTTFSLKDVHEVFDIRILHEYDILRILIYERKLKEVDFKYLTELVNQMVGVVNSDLKEEEKIIKVNKMDMDFHFYLWNKSDSKRRIKILKDMFFQLKMAMMYDTNVTGDLMQTATDHYEIIEHLKNGDLEQCKKAFLNHIDSYKKGEFENPD